MKANDQFNQNIQNAKMREQQREFLKLAREFVRLEARTGFTSPTEAVIGSGAGGSFPYIYPGAATSSANFKSNDQFNETTKNASPEDIQKIEANLSGMNRGVIVKSWDKVLMLWELICDPDAAWWAKTIAIGALIYLISPIDAIPDFIPVVGLTDDVGVILLAVSQVLSELKKYKG